MLKRFRAYHLPGQIYGRGDSRHAKKLVILGQGGYAYTVKDVAEQLGYDIIAMLDDKDLLNPLSSFVDHIYNTTYFVPTFGNNEFRLSWIDRLQNSGAKLATLIHPTAYVSPCAIIHQGTIILPKAIINRDAVIERGGIVNIGAIVDHGTVLEEGVHLAPGAIVKGDNRIPRCMKVESGEVIQARQYPL